MKRYCVRCSAPIERRGTKSRYCTQACYWEHLRERSEREPRLRGRSRALRLYAVEPCEVCGATERPEYRRSMRTIHRHHRDGDQTNNDRSNIAFLCKPCHTEAHRVMRAAGIGRKYGGPRPRIVALMHDRAVERRNTAARLMADGLSKAEVAAVMGVHRNSVDRWFAKYGYEVTP